MGFFSKVTKAVKKAVTGGISSTQKLLKGDYSGALKDAVGAAPLDPWIAMPAAEKLLGKVTGAVSGSSSTSTGDPALDFARAQYKDWQSIYGPVQDNLSNYYSNLTPEYYERQGLQAFAQERNNELSDLDTMIRQENLTGSAASELLRNESITNATGRASIRANSAANVANQQQAFLSIGLGSTAATNYQSQLNSNTSYALQQAAATAQAKAQTASAITTGVGSLLQTGIKSYFGVS